MSHHTQVRIGGRWLHTMGRVSDLTDSTIFRTEGWSGDYQASATLTRPAAGWSPLLRRGMAWETYEAGVRTWAGFVDEATPTDSGIDLSAYGRGSRAGNFPATNTAGDAPSYVPNAVVDAAAARGLGFTRDGVDLGSAAVANTPGEVDTVSGVLDRRASTLSRRWWVDSYGRVTMRDVGAVKWIMRPGEDYMGVADDEYASRLWGLYISAVDANNDPTAWKLAFYAGPGTTEADLVAKLGPREPIIDFTALGLTYDATSIRTELQARYERTGARMGWTSGLEVTTTNVRRAGTNVAAPLSIRAGDRILLPGVSDGASSLTYRPTLELTLGTVTRIHDEKRAQLLPVDLVPRGFAGALEAAQAPRELVTPA